MIRLLKFCIVGGVGLVIDFALTFIFKEKFRINQYVANSVGFTIATISNFVFNKFWTFEDTSEEILKQYTLYLCISIIGLLLNNGVIYLLSDKNNINFYWAKIIAVMIVTAWNFIANMQVTFSI